MVLGREGGREVLGSEGNTHTHSHKLTACSKSRISDTITSSHIAPPPRLTTRYGMVENCCGGTTLASDVWRRTLATVVSPNATDPHGTAPENIWDFSSWVPDAVVINLGTERI